ncbi:MAG: 6-phosphogluconolactonase [Myxococcota bacterium]|nr:6-phosphogluconolactonase [Myxococcota bacterium]
MSLTHEICADAAAVAARGAELIAEAIREAVAARGRALVALSGGSTPLPMWRALAEKQDLPWLRTHLFQVDERVAPGGDPARNWTALSETLLDRVLAAGHPMPVEAQDLFEASVHYAATLASLAGTPPVLDLAHLGLGADGHTASLVPGDAVLRIADRDVAVTQPYQGHRRMTLTFPMLGRARRILFVVAGADKQDALAKVLAGDASIPAGRVRAAAMHVVADRAAAEAGSGRN